MAEIEPIEAYAVVDNGKIDVRTVSETQRAAMVNFLVIARHVQVFQWTTDDEIKILFRQFAEPAARVVGVVVDMEEAEKHG